MFKKFDEYCTWYIKLNANKALTFLSFGRHIISTAMLRAKCPQFTQAKDHD